VEFQDVVRKRKMVRSFEDRPIAREVVDLVTNNYVTEVQVDKVMDGKEDSQFEPEEVAQTVREAFQDEVEGAVAQALKDVVAGSAQEEVKKPAEKGKQ